MRGRKYRKYFEDAKSSRVTPRDAGKKGAEKSSQLQDKGVTAAMRGRKSAKCEYPHQ